MVGVNVSYINVTFNITDRTTKPLPYNNGKETIQYFTVVAYLLTFAFGIFGNSIVLYIIGHFRQVRQKSVANYYIWNLAFADILCILQLPFFCYATYFKDWPFGVATYKIASVSMECNRFCSIFTLVALSVDRYLASYHKYTHLRTIQVGKLVCACIWAVCLIISTPYWLYATVYTNPRTNRSSIKMDWPEKSGLQWSDMWACFQLFFGLVLPLMLIIWAYTALALRVRKIGRLRQQHRISGQNRKMTRTVAAVVTMFVVFQTPFHVVQLYSAYKRHAVMRYITESGKPYFPSQTEQLAMVYSYAIANVLVYISSCCNPVIYGLLNDNFRKLYRVALCSCRTHRSGEEVTDLADGPLNTTRLRVEVTFHMPCECLKKHAGEGDEINQNNPLRKESDFLELGPTETNASVFTT